MLEKIPLDLKSGAPIMETPEEFYRNNGYYAYYTLQATQSTEMTFGFTTGSYPLLFRTVIDVAGLTTYKFLEGCTISAGTTVLPITYNRIMPQSFSTVFKTGLTYTSTSAIALRNRSIAYGSNPGQATTGAIGENAYFILKTNTSYVMSLTPTSSYRMTIDAYFLEKH